MTRRIALPGFAAALLALGASQGLPPQAAGAATAAVREFVAPTKRRTGEHRKKKAKIKGGGKPEKWQVDKRGNAIDGRGDFRSAKRLRRQIIERAADLSGTGRQWVRFRKLARRVAPQLLTMHPVELSKLTIKIRRAA